MATNFPTSLDTLTNPVSTNLVSSPSHADQHSNANDAIEALEAKVGADGSGTTTSHDYKLSEVTSTDKAVGKTATQTLTNKTLTSPKVGTSVLDTNGNELAKLTATSSAVNEVTLANGATGNGPSIKATGDDTNIPLVLGGKGTKSVEIDPGSASSGDTGAVGLRELAANGTNKTGFKAPDSLSSDLLYTMPTSQGGASTFLQNNGSGVLSWAAAATTNVLTIIPKPWFFYNNGDTRSVATTTTAMVGQVNFPIGIVANKVTFEVTAYTSSGTVKLGLFTEDGQTQVFTGESGTISGTGTQSITLSAVAINPGNYWLMAVGTGTVNASLCVYDTDTLGAGIDLLETVSGEPTLQGTYTVSAGTIPATITLASISSAVNATLAARFDN